METKDPNMPLDWNDMTTIINSTVESYMTDLVHDGITFAQNIGQTFVWEIRKYGTHLFRVDARDMMRCFRENREPNRRYFLVKVNSVDRGPNISAKEIDRREIP